MKITLSRSSVRKKQVKTPGGRISLRYEAKKPQKPHCASCGKVLQAVAHGTPVRVRKLSKTQRRPQRPYAGVFCSSCSRKKIMERSL